MSHGISTEWEDIQVKLGNYLPREKETTNNEMEKAAIEAVENYDPLEKKNLEELKELEDDEDDDVLKEYMEKRMQEMKIFAAKPKFGRVIELRKQDYIPEVTNAPKDVYVVLHLYQTYSEPSNILDKIFEFLAQKFPLVKFMKIVATNCVESYKDVDVPGVIIYQNARLIRQFMPAPFYFGGKNLSWKSIENFFNYFLEVEWIFSSLGIVKTDMQDDPFDEEEHLYINYNKMKKVKRDDESDEEDNEDRQYNWKVNK
jgi:hypothetical protein